MLLSVYPFHSLNLWQVLGEVVRVRNGTEPVSHTNTRHSLGPPCSLALYDFVLICLVDTPPFHQSMYALEFICLLSSWFGLHDVCNVVVEVAFSSELKISTLVIALGFHDKDYLIHLPDFFPQMVKNNMDLNSIYLLCNVLTSRML